MDVKPKRQPRIHFSKSPNPYSMEMIQQGEEALEALDRLRCLTSWQLCKLLFLNQPNTNGQKRGVVAAQRAVNHYCLRRLKDSGLVEVLPVMERVNRKSFTRHEVNSLTSSGRKELLSLRNRQGDDRPLRYVTDLKGCSPHDLLVKDLIIALEVGFRDNGVTIEALYDAHQLESLNREEQTRFGEIIPDGLVIVSTHGKRKALILEADRGTEGEEAKADNAWFWKMKRYGDYFKDRRSSDPLLARLPQPIVLSVTSKGLERMQGMLRATAKAGGKSAYWFTCRSFLEPNRYAPKDGDSLPDAVADELWFAPGFSAYQSLLDALRL